MIGEKLRTLKKTGVTYFKALPMNSIKRNNKKKLSVYGILTFKRRIKSHLPFEDITRSSPYSTSFQDKG